MDGRIGTHQTLAGLLADKESVRKAIELINSLERLEAVVTINGTTQRFPIRYTGTGAYIEIELSTATASE